MKKNLIKLKDMLTQVYLQVEKMILKIKIIKIDQLIRLTNLYFIQKIKV